jgi:hypothetical protein
MKTHIDTLPCVTVSNRSLGLVLGAGQWLDDGDATPFLNIQSHPQRRQTQSYEANN